MRVALCNALIAGRPLDEPIARYGSFEMNTNQIFQAVNDFRGTLPFFMVSCPIVRWSRLVGAWAGA